MTGTLEAFLNEVIREGALDIAEANGNRFRAGIPEEGRAVPAIKLHSEDLSKKMAACPKSAAANGYASGKITVEEGTLYDFLRVIARNMGPIQSHPSQKGIKALQSVLSLRDQFNTAASARRNVAAHYDVSDDFFKLFLDADMQYSSAYFPKGDEDLETAQQLKQDYIIDALHIPDNGTVLDIGSGWGSLAVRIAKRYPDVKVTGITLSDNQLQTSRERAAKEDVSDRVTFELCDYRAHKGSYDRVVSVEMLEHVGRAYYDGYFAAVKKALKPGGRAVICSGGRKTPQPRSNAFMQKYIFPGYYTPAMSQLMPAIEKNRLWMTGFTCDKRHYERTLALWYERYAAKKDTIIGMFGDEFYRMWELYFTGARLGYDCGYWMLFHMILFRDAENRDITALPERL